MIMSNIGRFEQILRELNSRSRDFLRAKKQAEELITAIEHDPGLKFDLRTDPERIRFLLKEIALRRGHQLLESLRHPTRGTPGGYFRRDVREIEEMKEGGILSYAELETDSAELNLLARER